MMLATKIVTWTVKHCSLFQDLILHLCFVIKYLWLWVLFFFCKLHYKDKLLLCFNIYRFVRIKCWNDNHS